MEAESVDDLESLQVLEYGRRPCAPIDEEEVPDTEEDVVTEEPGVRHVEESGRLEGVAEPNIEVSFF